MGNREDSKIDNDINSKTMAELMPETKMGTEIKRVLLSALSVFIEIVDTIPEDLWFTRYLELQEFRRSLNEIENHEANAAQLLEAQRVEQRILAFREEITGKPAVETKFRTTNRI